MQEPAWDPEKARLNLARHGVSFGEGQEAVLDRLSRSWPDTAHSGAEERAIVIGESRRGRLLTVVVVLDEEGKMRIISARRATKRERHAYEDL
ncbi:MAG: BrnT family toxin [Chloroflexota bacterium]